ncbi:MAG TPA: DUF2721 domain-containing protein [Candidatus Acidoferrales bacterium]|nr:DUF2721 domain-containing protein [Candidatus Acidoferrales bacterium]
MIDPSTPFAMLAGVVPPALLTNASSLLLMGLGNRVARVIDRTRTVAVVMAGVQDEPVLLERLQFQADLLKQRARALSHAIRLAYFAVGGFSSEVLITVLAGVLAQYGLATGVKVASVIALLIGILSVGSLLSLCVLMVRESTLALDNLQEEARTVMLEASRRNVHS